MSLFQGFLSTYTWSPTLTTPSVSTPTLIPNNGEFPYNSEVLYLEIEK